MSEYANEPVRGLPGQLPEGEYIVWQGSPAWLPLGRRAFHTHLVAGYFVVLVAWSALTALTGQARVLLPGVGVTLAVGVAAVALLGLLAFLAARATVYTITSRRIVLRFGIALPKCINLPFSQIAAAGLKVHGDGSGDLALTLKATRLGYVHLWPNVRPWQVAAPEPMLRALAEPAAVAALLADAVRAAAPSVRPATVTPAYVAPQAVAA